MSCIVHDLIITEPPPACLHVQRRDLARLEQLAERARKAESAGFALTSHPGSPGPGSARSARSNRSRASNLHLGPHSAGVNPPLHSATSDRKHRSPRSPLPPAAIQAEYFDSTGDKVRIYAGNGTINLDPAHPDNGGAGDPFADNQSVSTRGSGGTGQSGGTNIIPIQYVSSSGEVQSPGQDRDGSGMQTQAQAQAQTHAARTLNEARENLFRAGPGVPQRPARAPGLDLRLNANTDKDRQADLDKERSPQAHLAGHSRESFLSGTSGAPSFLSGYTADLHLDAPKIITSKQVQIGRLQQAEVVHFGGGGGGGGPGTAGLTPGYGSGSEVVLGNSKLSPVAYGGYAQGGFVEGQPISPALSAVRTPRTAGDGTGSGSNGGRQLTPSRQFDDADNDVEDVGPAEDQLPSPGDLRFSMGSLAYRDSVSTMGTSRYLAGNPSTGIGLGNPALSPLPGNGAQGQPYSPPQPPRAGFSRGNERESMMSARSDSSGLSAFPMIPPGAEHVQMHLRDHSLGQGHGHGHGHGHGRTGGIPQSTSVSTLDHAQFGTVRPDLSNSASASASVPPPTAGLTGKAQPPSSFRLPPASTRSSGTTGTTEDIKSSPSTSQKRPDTTVSVADSFLGSFPFVPPNMEDMADMPAGANATATASATGQRNPNAGGGAGDAAARSRYTAMSTASEGLGGFEFRFGDEEEGVPEVPRQR